MCSMSLSVCLYIFSVLHIVIILVYIVTLIVLCSSHYTVLHIISSWLGALIELYILWWNHRSSAFKKYIEIVRTHVFCSRFLLI